jgi:hypothetical protein
MSSADAVHRYVNRDRTYIHTYIGLAPEPLVPLRSAKSFQIHNKKCN